jgi:hypothetical protein
MKRLYSALLLSCCCVSGFSQNYYSIYINTTEVLAFDNPADTQYVYPDSTQANNLWQIGPAQKPILNGTFLSPPNVIVTDTIVSYPANNQSSFTVKLLVSNNYYDFLETHFDYKLDTDTLLDGGMIEVSRDSGLTWLNVVSDPTFDNTWGGYGMYTSADTVAALGQPGFSGRKTDNATFFLQGLVPFQPYSCWLRFTFASDSINTSKDGWLIDNIIFYGFLESIPEYDLVNDISIYPNPAGNELTFATKQTLTKPVTVSFFDAKGELAGEVENVNNSTVQIPDLADGLYFVTFVSDNFYRSKKIFIRK